MRILLTGACGFIGSSVGQRLLARGDEVVALDNFDPFYSRALKEKNLELLRTSGAPHFHEGDILDTQLMARLMDGVDAVIHLAALAGVRPSLAEPARYMRVNVEGTALLLEAARRAGVERLVVASSSSVYGSRSQTPFRESDPCNQPASPYAASKRATELICSNFHDLYGLGISCLRYFTVYGPRQRPEMAIHLFARQIERGEAVVMFGDGSSGRDYTYIDDIVDGTIAALDRQQARFRVYNLGGAEPISLAALIDAIGQTCGKAVQIVPSPWQPGDVPITSAELSLSGTELGYAPKVPLNEGLARFVAWLRSQQS